MLFVDITTPYVKTISWHHKVFVDFNTPYVKTISWHHKVFADINTPFVKTISWHTEHERKPWTISVPMKSFLFEDKNTSSITNTFRKSKAMGVSTVFTDTELQRRRFKNYRLHEHICTRIMDIELQMRRLLHMSLCTLSWKWTCISNSKGDDLYM